MKIMATSFRRSHACTAAFSPPSLHHCQPRPLPETPGHSQQVWISPLWGYCSFLLGPWAHKVLFVPTKSLFPQSCVISGGSMVELITTSFKKAYAIPMFAAPRAPDPAAGHFWPIPPQQTLKHKSASVSVESPGARKVLFEPSEHLWWVWGLILNAISPLLPCFWGFSFALGCAVYFFGGIQYSPVNSSSAESCILEFLQKMNARPSIPPS